MNSHRKTLCGFEWDSDRTLIDLPMRAADGWCVRDSFCQLFGWEVGSIEWGRFKEGVSPDELDRLTDYLGLVWFDPDYEPHRRKLVECLDHPGVATYALHSVRLSHCAYEPWIRNLKGLPAEYQSLHPELFRLIVDLSRPPHNL
jgi:hypothetical protein